MRKIFTVLSVLLVVACNNSASENVSESGAGAVTAAATDTANYTSINWIDSSQNLGTINYGETAQIRFRFTNNGEKPLFIISVQPGCGCTVADYPKEPIPAGGEGVIVAAFDTKQASTGGFNKAITVTTNTRPNPNTLLYFEGVVKQEQAEQRSPVATGN